MEKKINFLAILPLWGPIIILLWLFTKMVNEYMPARKFNILFIGTGFLAAFSMIIAVALMKLYTLFFGMKEFVANNANILLFFIAGYLFNVLFFIILNKKMDDLEIIY